MTGKIRSTATGGGTSRPSTAANGGPLEHGKREARLTWHSGDNEISTDDHNYRSNFIVLPRRSHVSINETLT